MGKKLKLSYMAGAVSDTGTTKKINQDKICVKMKKTDNGDALFAIVCGGVGGMARGDVAANTVVREFSIWFKNHIEEVIENPGRIMTDWKEIIEELNERIWGYGNQKGIKLGTTMTVMVLLPDGSYYAANVGDSRLYHIEGYKFRLENEETPDKTREKNQPLMGCSEEVDPCFSEGSVHSGENVLLCTDGFYHLLFKKKLDKKLLEDSFEKEDDIRKRLETLIGDMKTFGEKDNISAVFLRVC